MAGNEPENILVDSDLDWGQDVKRLSARLRQLGARELHFTSLFPLDFRYNGLPPTMDNDYRNPSPGWNALGMTHWKGLRMGLLHAEMGLVPWPDRYPPTERIGKSIALWYFPYPEQAAGSRAATAGP